jgi:hypothetical protein
MEFRLLYEGELLPSGNQSRPSEKHTIRRKFHPQLRRLWRAEENLRELAMRRCGGDDGDPRPVNQRPHPITDEERFDFGIKATGMKWSRAGYEFVPLVTDDMALSCSLHVLLFRPEIEQKYILQRGDIDGQIKTLFDALRMPKNLDETGKVAPQADESPFFCLLEDDRLITEVRVTTDRLLLLPNKPNVEPNDCFAIIHVRLSHKNARAFDNWFG